MSNIKLVLPRFSTVFLAADYLKELRASMHRSQKDAVRYAFKVLAEVANLSELRLDMLQKQSAAILELDAKLRLLDALRLQLTYALRGESGVKKLLVDLESLQMLVTNRYTDLLAQNYELALANLPKPQHKIIDGVIEAIKTTLQGRVARFKSSLRVGARGNNVVFLCSLQMLNLVDDDRFVHPEFVLNFCAEFSGDKFVGYSVSGSLQIEAPDYNAPGAIKFVDAKSGVDAALSILSNGNFVSVAPKVPLPAGVDETSLKKSKRYVKSIQTSDGTITVSLKPEVRKEKLGVVVKKLVEDIVGVISSHVGGRLKYQTSWRGTSYKVTLHLVPLENKKTITVEALKTLEGLGFTNLDLTRLVQYLNNGDMKWRK